MFGVQELFCIYYSVVYLHFGLVKQELYFLFNIITVYNNRFSFAFLGGISDL
jgi:hypothetical protein